MIDYREAKEIALAYVADVQKGHARECALSVPPSDPIELVLVENETIEKEFGWVFFYDSKKYLETNDFYDGLLGNAPIIVDRRDGSITETGSAHSVEHYIEQYEKGLSG